MKPIVHIPHAALSIPAKPVRVFDHKLKTLITHMKETLIKANNPKGVGLAAPQIGESVRIFLIKPSGVSSLKVFINPEIIAHSPGETKGVPGRENHLEGCLSIPKIWGVVHRWDSITLSYQDEEGNKKVEDFSGFLATIIQHETDHINGILFTKRVVEQKEKLYELVRDNKQKEVLEEISLP